LQVLGLQVLGLQVLGLSADQALNSGYTCLRTSFFNHSFLFQASIEAVAICFVTASLRLASEFVTPSVQAACRHKYAA
jgi:hypothetical protein